MSRSLDFGCIAFAAQPAARLLLSDGNQPCAEPAWTMAISTINIRSKTQHDRGHGVGSTINRSKQSFTLPVWTPWPNSRQGSLLSNRVMIFVMPECNSSPNRRVCSACADPFIFGAPLTNYRKNYHKIVHKIYWVWWLNGRKESCNSTDFRFLILQKWWFEPFRAARLEVCSIIELLNCLSSELFLIPLDVQGLWKMKRMHTCGGFHEGS